MRPRGRRSRPSSVLLAALPFVVLCASCQKLGDGSPKPPPDARVVRALCTSELGGPKASIVIWRDANGSVTVLDLRPDPRARARASSALYDSRGREQARLPPIEAPTSPEALEVQRRRDIVIEDSYQAETLECRGDAGA